MPHVLEYCDDIGASLPLRGPCVGGISEIVAACMYVFLDRRSMRGAYAGCIRLLSGFEEPLGRGKDDRIGWIGYACG